MSIFSRRNAGTAPSKPAPEQLEEGSHSPIMNIIGRGLNATLPQEKITGLRSRLVNTAPMTANHEHRRAYAALDWLTRIWAARWGLLVPEVGTKLAAELAALPAIDDVHSAERVGRFIMAFADMPDQADNFVASNYKEDNFYDSAALTAARTASSTAVTSSAGAAFADAAASVILDVCMTAKTDVALNGVTALSLMHCLDSVWPYIETWANGPGDFDAKKLSIGNLAPAVTRRALEPTIATLQESASELYIDLYRLG